MAISGAIAGVVWVVVGVGSGADLWGVLGYSFVGFLIGYAYYLGYVALRSFGPQDQAKLAHHANRLAVFLSVAVVNAVIGVIVENALI